MDKLSELARTRLQNAFGNDGESAKEIADKVDDLATLASQYQTDEKYSDVGFMIATATDNTDAVTMKLKVGDMVATIKNAGGVSMQTIAVDDEFVTPPAVGDLLIAKRPTDL